ncbi:glycine-rich RNA-binding protein 3 [Abeliophyllum distichum]|uniref:Glycine-rich RNA-binding protein 3 n=1 Tax=Abeliophyllum distichum TaxID=126358 RepID=A0ABD1SHL6_9LAMI
MAFVNRIGNMLKQNLSKHVNLGSSASNPSLFQAIRSMSSSKLFVGGLSWSTDEMSLREAFSQYGEVVEARIILDRDTGRSRGFGFVTYTSTDESSSAIQALDGKDLHGRSIRVNYATEKPRDGGFGTGGGFNYGGNGGNYAGPGYQGGNFGGGNFGGGGGFGGANDPSEVNNYSGRGGSYDGSGGNYYPGSQSGFSSGHGGSNAPYGESQEQLAGQSGMDTGNENFGPNVSDGNNRDEPNDYANYRA